MHCITPYQVGNTWKPCGFCHACLVNRRRIWTGRCILEAHHNPLGNSFVTLTYEDNEVPITKNAAGERVETLEPKHLKGFIDRFRKVNGAFRYFACGEYGKKGDRPHYHLIMFGIPPTPAWEQRIKYAWSVPFDNQVHQEDKHLVEWIALNKTREKRKLIGFTSMSEANVDRMAYVANYVTKKLFARNKRHGARKTERNMFDNDLTWEEKLDQELAETLDGRAPEFQRQSQSIGKVAVPWLLKNYHSKAGAQAIVDNCDVIGEFRYMGKTWPIGNTIKNHLRIALGIPKKAAERQQLLGEPPKQTDFSILDHLELADAQTQTPYNKANQATLVRANKSAEKVLQANRRRSKTHPAGATI